MRQIGILGVGEIGKSIVQLYPINEVKLHLQDLFAGFRFVESAQLDVLHVTVPCRDSSEFVRSVAEATTGHGRPLVIVHSTVPVGTT